MDGGSQICDGPTSRPAIFVFQNLASAAAQTRPDPDPNVFVRCHFWPGLPKGAPGPAPFFPNLAGRLVGPSHIWLPPSILGVYYWYWYIIGYNLMYFVYNPIICLLLDKKKTKSKKIDKINKINKRCGNNTKYIKLYTKYIIYPQNGWG